MVTECDIGKLLDSKVNINNLSRDEKYLLLTSDPCADSSSYPRTRSSESAPYRQFQPSWLKSYPWLHYSRHHDGAYCRACAVFVTENVGGQTPGQFVTKHFRSWKKTEKLAEHAKREYHLVSVSKMSDFINCYKNPSRAIDVQMQTATQKRMEENQKVIGSLFKVVLLCGKQGLALRGHRDDQIKWDDDALESNNEGNFIELVRFRAETDENLKMHLQNAQGNAMYTSKTIQNQLIEIIGKRIQLDLLSEAKQAAFYSVIADEVCDVSNKEQLSLCLRYVHEGVVKEVFLDFAQVERITGKELANTILHNLAAWGLPLSKLRGQCYDGSSNMSGSRSGCSTIIKEQSPMAVYAHCAAHQLNLAVVSACKIQAFHNAESFIGEVARFFKFSAKRQQLLDKSIDLVCQLEKKSKLKDACRTRWIQRIDSYAVFMELLPAVNRTLHEMVNPGEVDDDQTEWNWDGETVIKASGFLHHLESSTFLIAFKILLEILSSIRGLTLKLQMEALDVLYAYREVRGIVTSLKTMRFNSDKEFSRIFSETTVLGKDLHGKEFELNMPRVTSRQTHRSNVDVRSAEDYYRITLYNEFLSHTISELQSRFVDNSSHLVGLLYLLPSQCSNLTLDEGIPSHLTEAVKFYSNDLPHSILFPTEYRMWVMKWKQQGSGPKKLVDALEACDSTSFPNIHTLLLLILTLPITSCESERSFSQLKLIKTPHRSTMTANRLSGLALMKMNRSICDYLAETRMNELIQMFKELHPRRLRLPYLLSD